MSRRRSRLPDRLVFSRSRPPRSAGTSRRWAAGWGARVLVGIPLAPFVQRPCPLDPDGPRGPPGRREVRHPPDRFVGYRGGVGRPRLSGRRGVRRPSPPDRVSDRSRSPWVAAPAGSRHTGCQPTASPQKALTGRPLRVVREGAETVLVGTAPLSPHGSRPCHRWSSTQPRELTWLAASRGWLRRSRPSAAL
jgi:hypothetical protein